MRSRRRGRYSDSSAPVRADGRLGYAVIDVVFALTLAGIAVLLAHAGISTVLDMTRRAEGAREQALTETARRRQLVSWVRAAVVNGSLDYWDFYGAPSAKVGGYTDAVLSVVTYAPGPFAGGRLRLTLAIDRDTATPERGLVAYQGPPEAARVDTLAIDTAAAPPRAIQVVEPHATAFNVRYLHTVKGQRFWTGAWGSSGEVPEAIELRLYGDSIPPLLRLPIFIVPRGAS